MIRITIENDNNNNGYGDLRKKDRLLILTSTPASGWLQISQQSGVVHVRTKRLIYATADDAVQCIEEQCRVVINSIGKYSMMNTMCE